MRSRVRGFFIYNAAITQFTAAKQKLNTLASELVVAILTPPGRGAVATIRLDGLNAAQIAATHFLPKTANALTAGPANRLNSRPFPNIW